MLRGETTTSDFKVLSERLQALSKKRSNTNLLLGLKNPSIQHKQIKMFSTKNQPPIKIIIGIRNPIFWFQSFYNYRVWEKYRRMSLKYQSKLTGKLIPTPNDLVKCGTTFPPDVNINVPRFEFNLMKLNKVFISDMQSNSLIYYSKCRKIKYSGNISDHIVPNDSKIFLYDLTQLQDVNEIRSTLFRKDMQRFLGLDNVIKPFPLKNSHLGHDISSNLQINICDDKHDKAYNLLMEHANLTVRWIIDKFIQSSYVYVGNHDHFVEIVESWIKNPCNSSKTN